MANVTRIDLDDHSEPEYVSVRLCVEEAALVAKVLGRMAPAEAQEIMPGCGITAHHQVYETLTGDFFNRFWDGGVDEALRDL